MKPPLQKLSQNGSPQSIHVAEIEKLFGPGCFYDGEVTFEHPLMLIGFTNRSGSSLLGEYLRSCEALTGFDEFLNYPSVANVSKHFKLTSFDQFLRQVSLKGDRFGFKASADQIEMLDYFGALRMYPGLKILHIIREDRLSQAVSLLIASQTKQWTSAQDKQSEATFSRRMIQKNMTAIKVQNERIHALATSLNADYASVTYEELERDPVQAIARAATFFGVEPPETLPVPKISRQSNALNEAFIARFKRSPITRLRRLLRL